MTDLLDPAVLAVRPAAAGCLPAAVGLPADSGLAGHRGRPGRRCWPGRCRSGRLRCAPTIWRWPVTATARWRQLDRRRSDQPVQPLRHGSRLRGRPDRIAFGCSANSGSWSTWCCSRSAAPTPRRDVVRPPRNWPPLVLSTQASKALDEGDAAAAVALLDRAADPPPSVSEPLRGVLLGAAASVVAHADPGMR